MVIMQVPLGILPKCEIKHVEMIDIMKSLQKYVPVHTDEMSVEVPGIGDRKVYADSFHHILFGGDMLTAKRAHGSKHIRSNSTRGLDQLQGLVPVVEDWHSKVCFLGVSIVKSGFMAGGSWSCMYS